MKGRKIPISARLMTLADVYDALTSRRVYKEPFTPDKVKEMILLEKGHHFDPTVVEAFLSIEKKFVEIANKYTDQPTVEVVIDAT